MDFTLNDMTMCPGGKCLQRFSCLRYLADVSGRQDFFSTPPFGLDGVCDSFLDIVPTIDRMLNYHNIETWAYFLSTKPYSYDEIIWMHQELEQKIACALKGKFHALKNGHNVEIHFVMPPEDNLKVGSYYFQMNSHLSLQDLHWKIAEMEEFLNILLTRIKLRVYDELK